MKEIVEVCQQKGFLGAPSYITAILIPLFLEHYGTFYTWLLATWHMPYNGLKMNKVVQTEQFIVVSSSHGLDFSYPANTNSDDM